MEAPRTSFDARRRVARLARSRDGVISAEQVDRLCVSTEQLQGMLGDGALLRVAPGAFRLAGHPPTWRGDLRTGLIVLGPRSVVSHEAAARLHRLGGGWREVREFTVRRRRGPRLVDAVVWTTRSMPARDVTVVDGIAVTSVTRTLIDLATRRGDRARLESALDVALASPSVDPQRVVRRVREMIAAGRPGAERLVPLLVVRCGAGS